MLDQAVPDRHAVAGEHYQAGVQVPMDQPGLVGGLKPQGGLVEQAEPDPGY